MVFGALAGDRHFLVEAPSMELSAVTVDRCAQDSADVEDPEFTVPVYSNGLSTDQGLDSGSCHTTSYFFETRRSHAIRAPPVSHT